MRVLTRRILMSVAAGAVMVVGTLGWVVYGVIHPPLAPPIAKLASLKVGKPDGSATTLGELAPSGKPTLIAMWASWCVPCRAEAPAIAALRKKYGSDKLNIVYANLEGVEAQTPESIKSFLSGAGLDTQDYVVIDQVAYRAIAGTGAVAIPRTYMFDKSGQPTSADGGYSPQFEQEVSAMVEKERSAA